MNPSLSAGEIMTELIRPTRTMGMSLKPCDELLAGDASRRDPIINRS
jgi:hypothetical protein